MLSPNERDVWREQRAPPALTIRGVSLRLFPTRTHTHALARTQTQSRCVSFLHPLILLWSPRKRPLSFPLLCVQHKLCVLCCPAFGCSRMCVCVCFKCTHALGGISLCVVLFFCFLFFRPVRSKLLGSCWRVLTHHPFFFSSESSSHLVFGFAATRLSSSASTSCFLILVDVFSFIVLVLVSLHW